jgi:hypothetical protein
VIAVAGTWIACNGYEYGGKIPWPPCHYPGEPCENVVECCHPQRECGSAVCSQGVCELDLLTQAKIQIPGDCRLRVCDDTGSLTQGAAPNDIPYDGNPCTQDLCEEDAQSMLVSPSNLWEPKGPAPDGSGFCDGEGSLADCVETADCKDASLVCTVRRNCVPRSCEDGILDGGEVNVDCGGPCEGCLVGDPCNSPEDCIQGVCGPDKRCATFSCDDGVQNGLESDVDCGGPRCDDCDDGKHCLERDKCKSSVCWGGICRPKTCIDGIKNGDETDMDCGGSCPPCK